MNTRNITAKDRTGVLRTLSRSGWARHLNKSTSSTTKTFRRLESTMNDQEMVDYITIKGTKWTKSDSLRSMTGSSAIESQEQAMMDKCSEVARNFLFPTSGAVMK